MDKAVETRKSQTTDKTASKRWHTPEYVVTDVNETASDFIAITDGTSFFS